MAIGGKREKAKSGVTSKSRIVASLRTLWLRSKERGEAVKRDHYTCVRCGIKQSTAKGKEVKICVHHKDEIDWENIVKFIRKELLRPPEELETLCVECHKKHHHEEKI